LGGAGFVHPYAGLPQSMQVQQVQQVQASPQAIAEDSKDVGLISISSSEVGSHKSTRRSWYSQTFEDGEGDDEGEWEQAAALTGSASAVDPHEPIEDPRLDLGAPTSSTTCDTVGDNVSEASTDVGSDDEDYRKRLVDLDAGGRHHLAAHLRQPVHEAATGLYGDNLAGKEDDALAAGKEPNADELAEMVQRRILKRQRQRQQRREQRVQESAQQQIHRRRRR